MTLCTQWASSSTHNPRDKVEQANKSTAFRRGREKSNESFGNERGFDALFPKDPIPTSDYLVGVAVGD